MTRLPPNVRKRVYPSGAVRYRADVMIDGEPKYGAWRADAREASRDADAMREGRSLGSGWTLGQALKAVEVEATTKRTEGTARWYREHGGVLKRELGGADVPLCGIGRENLERFVRDRLRHVKPATVNADLRALHRVFEVAIRCVQAKTNPVKLVDRPRADRPAMDWFEDADLHCLLSRVTDQPAKDLFVFLAKTGLRRSEMARLKPEHVHKGAAKRIVVAGKNATRIVPLADDASEAVKRMALPIPVRVIDETFREWRSILKDPRLKPHAMRHTFGTSLVRQGERPDVVMRLMGHRSITTTLRYWHETGEDSAKAVARMRRLDTPAAPPPAEQA